MNPPRSVLIVDESEETRTVLRSALEERGLEILEAAGGRQGLDLARQRRPDVVVLDLEVETVAAHSAQWADESGQNGAYVVLASGKAKAAEIPGGRFVSKPYHYAPLIRTIEAMAEQARAVM